MIDAWFPDGDWPLRDPSDVGFDPEKLAAAGKWLKENAVSAYGGSVGGDMSDPEARRIRVAEKDMWEREILVRIVEACA